jgi:hypothetical protein
MFLAVNAFLYVFLLVLVIIFISLEASISTTDVRCLFPLALRCATVLGVTSAPSMRARATSQTSCESPYFLSQSDPNSETKDARTGLAIFYQSVIIAIALFLAIAFVGTHTHTHTHTTAHARLTMA